MIRRRGREATAALVVVVICGAVALGWQDEEYREPVPSATVDPLVSPLVHQGGTVVLRVDVTANGRVSDIEVVSGFPALTGPVVEAVTRWRFIPARLADRPVAARTTVVVHVVLQRAIAPPPR